MEAELDGLLALSRLALAATFGWAGIAKLVTPGSVTTAAADLGIPPRLRGAVALGLSPLEVVVAVALLAPPPWSWWGAVAALGMLTAFTTATVVAVARGRRSPCRCFGRGRTGSNALAALVRNPLLAALAALVVWVGADGTGPAVHAWLAEIGPSGWLALAAGGGAAVATARFLWRRPKRPGPVMGRTVEASPRPRVAVHRHRPALTIGIPTYRDFDGVYFTLQALRLYQDLDDTELLVVDNFGSEDTRILGAGGAGGRYVLVTDVVGTAAAKEAVFREARGEAVLCCDSHVLLVSGAIARLKRFYVEHPENRDLLQGPMLYDDGRSISTHFEPRWRGQMYGTWATDPRGLDEEGEPFEIPMQGMGAFSCRTDAWPGFNPRFRGFGGEEGYIHEKFRRGGRRCLCLPWLRWMHRFGRPDGVPFPLTVEDKLRNYLIGHAELSIDTRPLLEHFGQYLASERIAQVVEDALGPSSVPEPSSPR
jgi:hypothetical protein